MAWWNKAWSAAKSAVSKAVTLVKKATKTVVKTISKAVKKVSSSVKKSYSYVKKSVSKAVKKVAPKIKAAAKTVAENIIVLVKKAEEKITGAKDFIKRDAEMEIEIASQKLIDAEDSGDKIEAEKREAELVKLQEAEKERVIEANNIITKAAKIKIPFLKVFDPTKVFSLWENVTGRKLTGENMIEVAGHIADWIIPVNAISKLMTGKNIDGEPAEFGGGNDWIDLSTGLLMFVPIGKVGTVVGRLGAKGYIKLFATKTDDAVRIFKLLNVDDQAKLLRGLTKTDDGVKVVNRLLANKALHKTLVNPTLSIVNRHIRDKILIGSGFSKVIRLATKPKTILWGLTGMLGTIGMAYSITFGTEWFAKEGLWELIDFPLGDRMRDYRFEPTAEKAARIQKDIDMLEAVMPRAQELVRGIAWLWPFTKAAWLSWADGIKFELQQRKDEFAEIVVPELIELPEEIESEVRDIIDGDTIDVSLDGFVNGSPFKLPQYAKTGHARIRIVGINSPEKSPKGEITCTGIEIVSVEKKWADEARERLLPLNDKKVTLRIDPDNKIDTHGRILAVVERNGEDIGLRQIMEGLACYYFREEHKFVDDDVYSEETFKAKEDGVGMWKGLEDVEREEDKIKIQIKSSPSNAKLFLDDVSLHHNTPSDEIELSDVIHLFTPGPHILSAEKGGISAMKDIEIEKGDNGEIELILETAPIIAEVPEEVVPEEVIPEVPEEAPPITTIAYTAAQEWAMKEAFGKIWDLTKGTEVMSKLEREVLIESFGLYTNEQKMALLPLWTDLEILTAGAEMLSKAEFLDLLSKHQIEMEI